jgi:hypothetical protein
MAKDVPLTMLLTVSAPAEFTLADPTSSVTKIIESEFTSAVDAVTLAEPD